MCGICGFTFSDKGKLLEMLDSLKHRGPDDMGYLVNRISMGNTRLSIIDLRKIASQPLFNEDGSIAIVFNGEIYNFIELKEELSKRGHKFKTRSDTEVIVHAYEEWGFDCVKKFNGMWAFAIFDSRKDILFLSRDCLGIKPLYYYFDAKRKVLYFASEIKAILRAADIEPKVNFDGIIQYLVFRDTIDENTVYEGIKKLMPGHNLVFHIGKGHIEIEQYWDVPYRPIEEIDESKALSLLEKKLKKSIEFRVRSDVPVGAILSGGLDSSVVTALMRIIYNEKRPPSLDEFYTFTVRFKSEMFDEGHFAKMVAKKYDTKHIEVFFDDVSFLETLEEYAGRKDAPIGVPNEIALYRLAQKIRSMGVKVVLSGEGSDEIFYGYSRIFRSPYDFERLKILNYTNDGEDYYKTKFKSLYDCYRGRFFKSMLDLFLFRYNYFSWDDIRDLFGDIAEKTLSRIYRHFREKWYKIDGDDYKRISYVFLKIHLPILLARVDNATMASGVESRVPFLDPDLVKFVFNLPNELKSRWKSTKNYLDAQFKSADEIAEVHDEPKFLLKKLGEKYLPKKIVRRKKQGFPVPFQEWVDEVMKVAEEKILNEKSLLNRILGLKPERIKSWIAKKKNEEDKLLGQKIWMLLALELWLEKWIRKEN
ncbi:MAG: asparagine synthase (glutamine-hydrolyzing) [Candidatus Njordarchaeia archaeon]